MAEELLARPQVRAPFQEMGREAVSQGVGTDAPRKCHSFHALRDQEANGSIGEPAPAQVDEQGVRPGTRLAADREIGVDGGPGSSTERNDPFFSAFTQHSNHSTGPVDLSNVETHELGAPNPRRIEKLADGAAPNRR